MRLRRASYSADGSPFLGVHLGDEFLISSGKIGVVWGSLPANDKLRREGIKHDGMDVELGRIELVH